MFINWKLNYFFCIVDWSRLPPEMLFMIFDHLKPEDQCIKALTETCKTFKEICESRLTHLHLDFDTVNKEGRAFASQRAYKEISVVNFAMPVDMPDLLNLFQSSIESVLRLNIGHKSPESNFFTPISKEALRFIFRCFPNVEELKITRTTMTRRSNLDIGRNDLPKLKKLTLHDVTDDVFESLKNVTWLKEIRTTGNLHSNSDNFKSFIVQQKNLTLLEARPTFFETPSIIFPTLRTFIAVAGEDIEELFDFAPNLENLELTVVGTDDAICTSNFLRSCRSDSLKTLNLIGYVGLAEEFLGNFPSLDIAKCSPNMSMSRVS